MFLNGATMKVGVAVSGDINWFHQAEVFAGLWTFKNPVHNSRCSHRSGRKSRKTVLVDQVIGIDY